MFWNIKSGVALVQVPMIYITELIKRRSNNATWGNLVFWASFCILGQPLAVMMYWTMFSERRAAAQGLVGLA